MKASIKDMEQDKTVTEASLLATAKKFNATWKDEIDVLNRDCIQSFSNFKCGTRIIQGYFLAYFIFKLLTTFIAALTELLECYAAFYAHATKRNNYQALRKELVNVQKLMVEVKEKRPQF